MPPVAAKETCKEMKLGNFYVQRRWNANKRSYDYCLGLDPNNAHYFRWWKTKLEDRDHLTEFLQLVNNGENHERWADIAEEALGILVIAERVPELEKFPETFLPEETTSWKLLNSLSDSIRNFSGCQKGSKARRKKATFPPDVRNLRWTVSFNVLYSTPEWEFQGNWEKETVPLTKGPDPTVGLEQLNTILCVASHGSQFIH